MHSPTSCSTACAIATLRIGFVLYLMVVYIVNITSPRAAPNIPQKEQFKDNRLHDRRINHNYKMQFDKDIDVSSNEIVVELMVVVDETTNNYHGNDTEHYVITVMNAVQKLWQSPSLAANVSLQINKLIILIEQPEDLTPVDDADIFLRKFCSWQRKLPFIIDESVYYDATLLITRTNLHIDGNYEATGIGYILGACDAEHRCSLNEDTSPMGLAMTIAHEIGHNLGMWHDGFHNPCPDWTFLMSGFSTGGTRSLLWSQCSRQSMRSFLSSSKATCLKNVSGDVSINLVDQRLPGKIYNADSQCRVLLGTQARDCSEWIGQRKCEELKCYPDFKSKQCQAVKRPPLDGTKCGPDAICLLGYCTVQKPLQQVAPNGDGYVSKKSESKRFQNLYDNHNDSTGIDTRIDTLKRKFKIPPTVLNNDSKPTRTYILLLSIPSFCVFLVILRSVRIRKMCRKAF